MFGTWFSADCHSKDLLYRLPVRTEFSGETAQLFERAIDSVLSSRFNIEVPDTNDLYEPDSNVCVSSLVENRKGTVTFSYDIFLAQNEGVISGTFNFPMKAITLDEIILRLQENLSEKNWHFIMLGRLRIQGTYKADVYLNDFLSGRVPFESFLTPAMYDIRVQSGPFIKKNFLVNVSAGSDTTLTVDLKKLSRPYRIGSFILGGASLVLGGLGHYIQNQRYDQYVDPDKTQENFDQHYLKYQRATVFRNISFVFSGVFFTTGLVLTFSLP